ncbi:MAG: response regulator, partial [Desulfobacterales bacterium]|nr:response regulator [Desulfobacterales bacterium]
QAQKMEAVGTLAGGVAHDLNNILSGVVSYPELLLLNMAEDHPLRKPVLTIKKSGERAVAIVQDLLTLARRGVSIKEIVNLNLIIKEYLLSTEFQHLKSFHRGISIETKLAPNLANINGSPVHLSKTVMNLVSNAAEAISGEGRIYLATQEQYIESAAALYDNVREGEYVVLTVMDTGIGIAPGDLGKIFEPFFTKKVMGRSGTGLGMAVVWGTVKDHGGYINVQSVQGKGTTFTIYLPLTRQEAARHNSTLSIDSYKGQGETVLIVDDVETQREIATGILEKLNYKPVSVPCGEQAIEYLKTHSVDLLLLDMIMGPGLDGLQTYKRIVALHPGQKALIASGYSETERVKEAQRLGAGPYIRKPYSIEKLGLAIRKELDGFKSPDEHSDPAALSSQMTSRK